MEKPYKNPRKHHQKPYKTLGKTIEKKAPNAS